MVTLPQLMEPPPRLPEGVAGLVNSATSATGERKALLDEALAALARRERELEELEQFVAGLTSLELEAEQGPQPNEEVIARAIDITEELFAWATGVTGAREDQLTRLRDQLEALCAGDESLTPLARQVYQRQEELGGRIQALATPDVEDLIGNLLVQVAKQRELSRTEKIRLLHTIPFKGPITDQKVSTCREDWYRDDVVSTRRADWYK